MDAFKKVLTIKPDYEVAYKNIGGVMMSQGKRDKAIEGYKKAIELKPDFAEAHRNLSMAQNYTKDSKHLDTVKSLIGKNDISLDDRCSLSFTFS